MNVSRKKAMFIGVGAVVFIAALQAFNSVVCYKQNLSGYLNSLWFILIPMLLPIASLLTKNPLRAVGGALMFAPWLVLAYYTDCIRPYTGGGASMIYIAVVMFGLPSAALGTLVTGPVLRVLGVTVNTNDQ